MKHLLARKVKDGWNVHITDVHHVKVEGDIYTLIRQNGLKIQNPVYDAKGNCKEIYAD